MSNTAGVKTREVVEAPPANQRQMILAIRDRPVAVGVNGDSKLFMFHDGKTIITNPQCGGNANHAVIAVGYGYYTDPRTKREMPYMIIKNSYDTTWGNNGYGYISMDQSYDKNGICSCLTDAVYSKTLAQTL